VPAAALQALNIDRPVPMVRPRTSASGAVTRAREAAIEVTGECDDLRALVVRAQAGDRAALDELIRGVRPHVFRYVLARLIDRASAEDVTQEVAMTIVSALPRYQDMGRPVLAWVFGIAMRKVRESHRTLRRHPELATDALPDSAADGGYGPESAAVRLETARRMAELLATLPHPQGEILRLRVAAGLTAEETAAVLDMTAGAVRVAQHRALARLRASAMSEALR
jgi:RNA polymerase sigma-70 factor (ECF subfamily)